MPLDWALLVLRCRCSTAAATAAADATAAAGDAASLQQMLRHCCRSPCLTADLGLFQSRALPRQPSNAAPPRSHAAACDEVPATAPLNEMCLLLSPVAAALTHHPCMLPHAHLCAVADPMGLCPLLGACACCCHSTDAWPVAGPPVAPAASAAWCALLPCHMMTQPQINP